MFLVYVKVKINHRKHFNFLTISAFSNKCLILRAYVSTAGCFNIAKCLSNLQWTDRFPLFWTSFFVRSRVAFPTLSVHHCLDVLHYSHMTVVAMSELWLVTGPATSLSELLRSELWAVTLFSSSTSNLVLLMFCLDCVLENLCCFE